MPKQKTVPARQSGRAFQKAQLKRSGITFQDQVRAILRRWFTDSKMTQGEAAELLGWDQRSLSGYFGGKQDIDLERAFMACAVFGRTIHELLDEVAIPTDPKIAGLITGFHRLDERRQHAVLALVDGMPEMRTSETVAPRVGRAH